MFPFGFLLINNSFPPGFSMERYTSIDRPRICYYKLSSSNHPIHFEDTILYTLYLDKWHNGFIEFYLRYFINNLKGKWPIPMNHLYITQVVWHYNYQLCGFLSLSLLWKTSEILFYMDQDLISHLASVVLYEITL